MNYTLNDIIESLHSAGLGNRDTVFVTTGLGMLGRPPEEVDSQEKLNRLFFDALNHVIGEEGTLLVPTYSYTFGKSTATDLALYDPLLTPAEIGPFPNYFLKQPGVKRSLDPMMSVAGKGPKCSEFFDNLAPTSYGEDSFFSRLVKSDAKCCSIGLGPNWTPFIHYADWLYNVPFRFDKIFYGYIKHGNIQTKISWVYSVRILSDESLPNAHKAGREAEEQGIWHWAKLGRARVYCANVKTYFDFVCSRLETDKWFLAKGRVNDVIELEKERVSNHLDSMNEFDLESWLCAKADVLNMQTRFDTVSDGCERFFDMIEKSLGASVTRIKSGTWIYDYIVPEKWSLESVHVHNETGQKLSSLCESKNVLPYSLNQSGTISRETLLSHINPVQSEPRFANRNWGFQISSPVLLCDSFYTLSIKTHFSLGELCYSIIDTVQDSKESVLFCSYLENDLSKIAGVQALLSIAAKQQSKCSFKILFTTGYLGFLSWVRHHPESANNVIHLGLREDDIQPGGNPLVVTSHPHIAQQNRLVLRTKEEYLTRLYEIMTR